MAKSYMTFASKQNIARSKMWQVQYAWATTFNSTCPTIEYITSESQPAISLGDCNLIETTGTSYRICFVLSSTWQDTGL